MKNLIFDFDINYLSYPDISKIIKFLKVSDVGIETSSLQMKNLQKLDDIELFSKLTLKEVEGINTKNLKTSLSKNRNKFDIIIVEPISAGVAAIAARDRRVDAVKISSKSMLKVFNTRYGRRLEENNKIVIIDLSIFWETHLAKNLRPLLRVLRSFSSCEIQYILSKNTVHPLTLRSYRGLQSISRLLEISNKQSDFKFLNELVEKNRKKVDGIIPFEGVEITEW